MIQLNAPLRLTSKTASHSLSDILTRRGGPFTKAQAAFMSDPFRMGQNLAAGAYRGGAFSHRRFTEKFMKYAVQTADLTAREFGNVFGASILN